MHKDVYSACLLARPLHNERGDTMKRVFLTLALLVVVGSATFVKADPQNLQEPEFPGAGAGEGDMMTFGAPGNVEMIGKACIGSLLTMSFYR